MKTLYWNPLFEKSSQVRGADEIGLLRKYGTSNSDKIPPNRHPTNHSKTTSGLSSDKTCDPQLLPTNQDV